jgi:nitrogen regulatory protein PII-like uncharacterized protein
MAWVVNFSLDLDKPNVGNASAVFTDTDNTTFYFLNRTDTTPASFQTFVQNAIAARNSWKARKTNETIAITNLVNGFNGAPGETATAGVAT